MRKKIALALSGTVVVAVAITAVAVAGNNPQRNGTQTADCQAMLTGDQGDFTYDGPVVAWPPNHKYRTATITLVDQDNPDDPMDEVTVAVTGTHDQMVDDTTEMNGAGNTDPATDVVSGPPGAGTGSASTYVKFRGERSGRDKTGRTYTFTVTGTTDDGASECEPVEFTALVPHDQRKP